VFEALAITLREGVEAALVLAIALAFLTRRGRGTLAPALFGGAAVAVALSIGIAALTFRVTWNEELAGGVAMLVGAVLVATLVVWMWKAAPRMRHEIESGMGRATTGGSGVPAAGGWGVFLFAFGMVLREGAETAIFLSAASFNREGMGLWLGALLGLALAATFGVLFVRGSLRLPLKPFFQVTSAVLALIALQLLVGGLHELSEAGVLPASRREMAIVGPLVKNELLLFTLTVALAAGWLLFGAPAPAAAADASGPEVRLARAARARELARRRWSGVVGLAVVGFLATAFVQRSQVPDRPPAQELPIQDGLVRFDPAPLTDDRVHFYQVTTAAGPVRFFALRVGDQVRTCLDGCEICGDQGYFEDGTSVVCRNCTSPIVRASIGRSGGCNPIPLAHRLASGTTIPMLEVRGADLEAAIPRLRGR
jgi:high-affinity iron transporter